MLEQLDIGIILHMIISQFHVGLKLHMQPQFNTSICLIIKDENEYINEWLDWHIKIGFEHFYIYDNGSKITIESSVKEEYK
jgi:hypothetical protein